MKLTVVIEQREHGLRVTHTLEGPDPAMDQAAINTFAIGALEVAKASLLANRWGVNIGDMKPVPLVKEDPAAAPDKEAQGSHK